INGAEPGTLDPAIVTVQADSRIVRALFEGLTRLDPKTATPVPAIAARWDISEDGKIYTFHLRTNAVWSTGEPITTADVIYSWRRVLDPITASEYASQLFFVKNAEDFNAGKIKDPARVGMKAIDPYTLQVELIGPTPFFLDLCAFQTLAVVPRFAIEKNGDRWMMSKPLPTSGPYTLEFWRILHKIRVRKNPRHWDAAHIQNNIVDFLPSESAMTAMNLYEARQADILWDKNLIPNDLMDVLGKRQDCRRYDYLGTFFMRFNVLKKPFNDVRVRKALAMTIDKKRIVERITRSGEKPASHFVPAGMAMYTSPEGYGYEPELARKLLAEAGFPGGKGFPTFRYLFKNGETDKQIGVELQAMWREQLGIAMELDQTESKVYYTAVRRRDYDVARSSWIGDYIDPNTFLDMFMTKSGNNATGWSNPRYDELVREGNRQTDPKKREKLLQQAETILIREDLPITPIYFYAGVLFARPEEIEGLYFNLLDEHPIYAIKKKVKRKT
ncbi:MAG: peptide ABC transporter substrate-binding protein, partial [Verrucomicrobiota bacterium]|nr:peptide ABC transporter substrate-binding protein [Verrucomicrobiota bacterium]